MVIEGLDGLPRLSLQIGGASDQSFNEQQQDQLDQLGQLEQLDQHGQLQQLEQLQQLQLEIEGGVGEKEEGDGGREILTSFLDQLEEENRR